jgi:hypothetical protein
MGHLLLPRQDEALGQGVQDPREAKPVVTLSSEWRKATEVSGSATTIVQANKFSPPGDRELDEDLAALRQILITTKRPQPSGRP